MTADGYAVLLCDSIHDVLGAERAVKEAGLWCDMVPAPRELSSDCGMVLQVRLGDLQVARWVVDQAAIRYVDWYGQSATGYERYRR